MRSFVKASAAFGPIVCALVACSSGSGGEDVATGSSAIIPKCQPGYSLDCSGDGPSGQEICTCVQNATMYPLPVQVTGLTTAGLVLEVNGGPTDQAQMSVSASGSYTLKVPYGSYSVFVGTQPNGQACEVTNGVGYMTGTGTQTVQVTCGPAYTVGGTASGITTGVEQVLELDFSATGVETQNFGVTQNGPFTVPITVTNGTPWSLTVASPPLNQECAVKNGSGTISGASVSNVSVYCINLPCGGSGQPECVACGGNLQPACAGGVCASGYLDEAGTCRPCGANGEPACAGGVCDPGTVNVSGGCNACGNDGEPACAGNVCNKGYVDRSNVCTPCGASGEVTCAGDTCNSMQLVDQNGTCVPCGYTSEPVCAGNVCASGLVDSGGWCVVPSGSSSGGSGSGSSSGGNTCSLTCWADCYGTGCPLPMGTSFCSLLAAQEAAPGCGVCCGTEAQCVNSSICNEGIRPPQGN